MRRRSVIFSAVASALAGVTAFRAPASPAAAAQDAGAMATHPIVGLWQSYGMIAPGPLLTLTAFHADGTLVVWEGLRTGTQLGIWQPTGECTADVLFIGIDTDPSPDAEVPGTATIRGIATIDDSGNQISYESKKDVRDAYGMFMFDTDSSFAPATRVTFEYNPMTGSTGATPTP